jgi:hypothetical protein
VTATTPPTERHFTRFCRWLLLAYPRPYRRRHGPEIVTTLLEMAPPGRRRPGPADAAHLLASGLRQRFRLPVGRPLALIAAIMAALAGGALGAAAGSWAGAQTFADLPGDAAMTAAAQRASGVPGASPPQRWSSPWWHESAHADTEVTAWDPEQARQRLAADGWTVSGITPQTGTGATIDETTHAMVEFPLTGARFTAEADGLVLTVRGHVGEPPGRPADRHGSVSVQAAALSTPVFRPLVVAGALLGLAAGWLVAAAVAYRMRRTPPVRWSVAVGLNGAALAALALPSVAVYGNVVRALTGDGGTDGALTVHTALLPTESYPYALEWLLPGLAAGGLVIAAIAALLARPAAHPAAGEQPLPG